MGGSKGTRQRKKRSLCLDCTVELQPSAYTKNTPLSKHVLCWETHLSTGALGICTAVRQRADMPLKCWHGFIVS